MRLVGLSLLSLLALSCDARAGFQPHRGARPVEVRAIRPAIHGPSPRGLGAARRGTPRSAGAPAIRYPGSPYTIEALLARRALNPLRFDHDHGHLGTILRRDLAIRDALALGPCPPMEGLLYPTPYHLALHRRRSLNPDRFDSYHPILGPLLAEDQRLRSLPPCAVPGDLVPPRLPTAGSPPAPVGGGSGGGTPADSSTPAGGGIPGGGSSPAGGGGVNPVPVPEPASLALLAVGALLLGARRLRRFNRHARRTLAP